MNKLQGSISPQDLVRHAVIGQLNDWESVTWGDIAILEYGKGLRDYDLPTGNYRVFGTNGPIGWTGKALCDGPTVVLGRKGAYRGVHYSAGPCYVIDTAFYLKPRQSFDMRWAYYAMLALDINSMDSGSAIPSTSRDEFYRLPLLLPPPGDQKAIADVLSALDDKIELNRRMSQTLEEIARALFKSWFVDFDPVHAKAAGREPVGMDAETAALFPSEFEDSELGLIPKGWEKTSLDKIADFLNGLALQKFPVVGDESLPAIKIAQLKRGSTDGADRVGTYIPERYVIHNGNILFSWSGTLELTIWQGGTGALNQHLFKVSPNGFPDWFVYFWIDHHLPVFREIAADKATTMGHIQRRHLTEALVSSPSNALLQHTHQVIGPLFDRVNQAQTESTILAAIRDLSLPELISGQLLHTDHSKSCSEKN